MMVYDSFLKIKAGFYYFDNDRMAEKMCAIAVYCKNASNA